MGTTTATAREAGQEAVQRPEPTPLSVALDLAAAAGGTFFGVAVLSMHLRLADGREVKIDLPTPAPDNEQPEATEDDIAAKVLEALEGLEPGSWCSGKSLAPAVGLTYGGGQFNRVIGKLKANGQIIGHKVHGYKLNSS